MATQAERRAQTKGRVLDAAHRLFIERGIAATSTEAILEHAGASRGAMYHHFPTRDALVAAVYEREAVRVLEVALRRGRPSASPRAGLVAVALAWLHEAARPQVARILVIDGPSALGFLRCREIEAQHSMPRVRAALTSAMEAGELVVPSIEAATRLVNAMLAEAALMIALAPAQRRARVRREVVASVRQWLGDLGRTDALR